MLLLPLLGYSQTYWTLEKCIAYALENNISIKQSEFDLQTTEVDKLQAKGAFLPFLNGNVTYSLNEGKKYQSCNQPV